MTLSYRQIQEIPNLNFLKTKNKNKKKTITFRRPGSSWVTKHIDKSHDIPWSQLETSVTNMEIISIHV